MCTNVPLGTSVAATRDVSVGVSYPQEGSPPPLTPPKEGEAGAHQAGQQMEVPSCNPGELPVPGEQAALLHGPECAKPSRAGGGPNLCGMVGETWDPGPSRLEKGPGAVP